MTAFETDGKANQDEMESEDGDREADERIYTFERTNIAALRCSLASC